jgi:CBS domain-containing protein
MLRQLLSEASVGDVMVRDPVSVPADLTLDRLVEDYILGRGFRGFPVVDGGRTLGLVSVERVKSVPPTERERERVRDHLEPLDPERAVTPQSPLVDAVAKMGRLGVPRLLVLRPNSSEVVGLLTQSGLARFVELRQSLRGAEA